MKNDFAASTLQILEIIGTLAFGASGLIAAARKKLDMVGVVLLVLVLAGVLAGCGGGGDDPPDRGAMPVDCRANPAGCK